MNFKDANKVVPLSVLLLLTDSIYAFLNDLLSLFPNLFGTEDSMEKKIDLF